MTEVARERNEFDTAVHAAQFLQHRQGAVGTAVVHENTFVAPAGGRKHIGQLPVTFLYVAGFIMAWQYDGQLCHEIV